MAFQPDLMKTQHETDPLWRDACAAVVRDITAQAFDITPELILKRQRGKEYVARARHVAMYLTHTVCGLTMKEVGLVFDRERTTVSYACHKVEDMRDDEYVDIQLDLFTQEITARLAQIRPRPALNNGTITNPQITKPECWYEKQRAVVGGEEATKTAVTRSQQGRLLYFKPMP